MMKRKICFLLAILTVLSLFSGCGTDTSAIPSTASSSTERVITDMAGRTVTIPAQIDSVFSAGPVAAIYLYTLVPDRLLGWNYELNDIEKSIIPEKYHSLPNFGQRDAINYEAVIAANPTIALNVGTMNEQMISECDTMQKKLGIPVIAIDGDLRRVPEAYRFMGNLFSTEENAEVLAKYTEKTFHDIDAMNIPEERRVRIYYGNGEDSLETAPTGSSHAQILELVGAVNAADLELGEGSRVQISAEQLLSWDPDVILVNGEPKADISGASAAAALMENSTFSTLTAVQEKKVYGTPNAPFSWIDRPNGVNRIVGIRWLSGKLYPEYLNFDVDQEVKTFFKLFYHVELTDEQLQKVYNGEM